MNAIRAARRATFLLSLAVAACSSTGPDTDPTVVTAVEIQPAQVTLHLGVSPIAQLSAVARNAAGAEVTGKSGTWRSEAPGVATVNTSGVVTAVGLGTAAVKVTIDGIEATASVLVAPAPVATVQLSLPVPVLVSGQATTAGAVVRDAAGTILTDRQVAFSTSDPGVAIVSSAGVVTAVSGGGATITATSEGKSGTAAACVLPSALNLRLDQVLASQVVQNSSGTIPLVIGGLPAEIRVYATSDAALPSGCLVPRLRFIAYDGTTETFREETNATGTLPTVVNLASPIATFVLPANRITAALRVLVELDPHDVIPETASSDNTWPPSGGPGPFEMTGIPPLDIRFVPIFLASGGSVGLVNQNVISEYLYATRQVYPLSEIDWDIGDTFSTSVSFGSGDQGPWVQILGELDVKRVIEGTPRYYVGALRPPPGVTFTQFGGFGYIPSNLASYGSGTRTAVLVGVNWFSRQRQTTELVAHELGHNHGRRHAPCGGASSADPGYPHPGAEIGVPGTDMYTWSLNSGSPQQLPAFLAFDIMSYCTPAWISDYTYEALIAARIAANPLSVIATGDTQGADCDCLVAWGSITGDSVIVNPAFVTRTRVQLPPNRGSYVIEGVRDDGGIPFSYAFEPAEIDHAPGVRHFAFAIPVSQVDRESLASLRVRGARSATTLTRAAGARVPREQLRLSASTTALRTTGDRAEVAWPTAAFSGALVRNARTGVVLGISMNGPVSIDRAVGEVEVILSDGVRSEVIRVRPGVR